MSVRQLDACLLFVCGSIDMWSGVSDQFFRKGKLGAAGLVEFAQNESQPILTT